MVSLGGFLLFWGWIFLSTTLLVALKAEERKRDDDTTTTSTPTVKETYRQLWRILQVRKTPLCLSTLLPLLFSPAPRSRAALCLSPRPPRSPSNSWVPYGLCAWCC